MLPAINSLAAIASISAPPTKNPILVDRVSVVRLFRLLHADVIDPGGFGRWARNIILVIKSYSVETRGKLKGLCLPLAVAGNIQLLHTIDIHAQ